MILFAGFIAFVAGVLLVAPHPGVWGIRIMALSVMIMLVDHYTEERSLSEARAHIWIDFISGLALGAIIRLFRLWGGQVLLSARP